MKSYNVDNNKSIPELLEELDRVRNYTIKLTEPLERDDMMVQSTPETSPIKWHLAHTTWFFEKFILEKHNKDYAKFDKTFDYLFNSYYETAGNHIEKINRKTIAKPSLETVMKYREYVQDKIADLFDKNNNIDEIYKLVTIGINHEQQHQELMLMDIKMNFYSSPYKMPYTNIEPDKVKASNLKFYEFNSGLREFGTDKHFHFDNESPVHKQYLNNFKIANRPVTNGEYIEFIEDNGYSKPQYWLSDGWDTIRSKNWKMPLYWEKHSDTYYYYTMSGLREIDLNEPAVNISYYEADAFARWKNMRLPTEYEMETAYNEMNDYVDSNSMESNLYHPEVNNSNKFYRFSGVWEWTLSPYAPYPGYKVPKGPVGEYNGKFMSSQMVLRGSSCITPKNHSRNTYRNFFHPYDRWQFSGFRLADDL